MPRLHEHPPRGALRPVPASSSRSAGRQAADVVALQRSAGNRALARWLVQRVALRGTVTPGAQDHHPKHEYSFGGEEAQTYDLDKWITGKAPGSPAGHAAALDPQAVADVIGNWDVSESIFAVLNRRLIGAAAWTPRAGGGFETTVDVPQEMADSEAGRLFAKHFLTLEENVALRERDVPANTPATITVTGQSKRGGRQKQVLTPDWNGVLATARGKLKDKLASGEPAPVEKEDVRLVDAVVLGDTDSAMKRLREIGLITGPGDAQFHATATSGAGLDRTTYRATLPDKKVKFNFGVNHLRFIIWLEWRAMTELASVAGTAV